MAESRDASKEDDDLGIPRAAVNKYIKDLVPNLRISADARELLLNCCTEFIHVLASEANEICSRTQKKTINPDHIVEALESLGFASYKPEVEAVLEDCREVAAKKRRGSSKLENKGIPEEELLRQQRQLFAQAREEQEALQQQEWQRLQLAATQALARQQSGAGAAASSQAVDSEDEY